MDRDNHLQALRPILNIDTDHALPDEKFQSLTLRPILKLQHKLLLTIFQSYLQEKSIPFSAMSAFKKRLTIENAVKKDLPLRHTLIGCIVGLFTTEEYTVFLANRVALNKRITSLLIQKLTDELISVPQLNN